MTITRSNIVRHVSMPTMFFNVVSVQGESAFIKPYKLSMANMQVQAELSDLTLAYVSEGEWRRQESRYSIDNWTFDTIGSCAAEGVPMSLTTNGARCDFLSLDGSTFNMADGSTVRRYDSNDYALGAAADWQTFEDMRTAQRGQYATNTVVELAQEHYGATHAILTGDGTDYPEQYAYTIDPETLERTTRDVYVSVSSVKPTGKTLEDWRDSLAPEVAIGNVVLSREARTFVVLALDSPLKVAELKADMSLGDESTLRRFDVAEVLASEVNESLAEAHAQRLRMAEQLQALSINTVNRALQHASSNRYCSETLIALTGAGHKAPKVRVSGTITIPLDITLDSKQDWEKVRDIFGAVFGDKQSWTAATLNKINLAHYINTQELATSDTLTVEPIYGAPTVRPLA